ncbi:MAG: M18 family aminopeptidase [Gammaproteobacteria bacterium]|nr:M18 family aminopeptidase [Gammaproteobacteria bacterium]
MTQNAFNAGLCAFLDRAPTPFHAVAEAAALLDARGYTRLAEDAPWRLAAPGRYYVTRNASSLAAFTLGPRTPAEAGLRLVGAHTDSPCLKLKPHPVIKSQGYWQLGVEVYGGVLLNPWFDRDLSVAGRATLRLPNGEIVSRLVDFSAPVAVIPSLAIHLDREANEQRAINKQTYLPALLACADDEDFAFDTEVLGVLTEEDPALTGAEVLHSELALYDTQSAAQIGLRGEFIASARLDNLLSCYVGLNALINAPALGNQVFVMNDHEEVGSGSAAGARGTFLKSVLERITGGGEDFARAMARSLLVSTDNAHGVHPNFPERHDGNHGPVLNRGPALKVNANQSYASTSESLALFSAACIAAGVTTQTFVSRGDVACGSTIGPLTATVLGVRTVDVGVPTFAMHSIRELAGAADAFMLHKALVAFYGMDNLGVG